MKTEQDSHAPDEPGSDTQEAYAPPQPTTLKGKVADVVVQAHHVITGTSREVLAGCPQSDKSFTIGQAVVMVLIAIISAFLLALKIGAYAASSFILPTLVWLIAMPLILGLEMMVVASIQPDSKLLNTFAVRVPMAVVLVLAQLLPTVTYLYRDRIALALRDQSQLSQVRDQSNQRKLLGVDGLKTEGDKLEAALAKAQAERAAPPADPDVENAKAAYAQAQGAEKQASSQVRSAAARVQHLQAQLGNTKDEAGRSRLQTAQSNAHTALGKAQGGLRQAQDSVAKALDAVQMTEAEQKKRLTDAVAQAQENAAQHEQQQQKVNGQLADEAAKAKVLAEKASASNFFVDISALLDLMRKDSSIRNAVVVVALLFIFLDLTPSLLKAATRNNLYNTIVLDLKRRTVAQMDTERAQNDFEAAKVAVEREKTLKLLNNEKTGVDRFVKEDGGTLHHQLLEIEQQHAVEMAALFIEQAATLDLYQRHEQMLEVLQRNHALVSTHPEIMEAHRSQMGQLLAIMEARTQKLQMEAQRLAALRGHAAAGGVQL